MSVRERLRKALPLEVKAAARTVISWIRRDSAFAARRKGERYLLSRGAQPALLHVGCGTAVKSGWLNVDFYPMHASVVAVNLRRGLRFLPDASIDFIYHEHFLEHLPLSAARVLLRECHRVLRPGGRMRVSVPDLEEHVRRYLAGGTGQDERFADYRSAFFGEPLLQSPGELLNLAMRGWEHQYLYDQRDLEHMLAKAGFTGMQRMEPSASDVEVFRAVETRPPEHANLILEASK
jgi:predicted SAM-dependent methyltransferase